MSYRFSSLRNALSTCALAAAVGVPIACAQGSTETDIGFIYGGAGGKIATGTTTATTSQNTGGQASTSSSSTSGFPSSSGTSGFPSSSSSSSSSGNPSTSSSSSSSSSTSGTTTTSSSSSSSSTSAGGSVCDSGGTCDTCAGCADQSAALCKGLGDACYDDVLCPDVFNCAWPCTNSACVSFCVFLWGDDIAEALFTPYYNCLLCSCENACGVSGCP